MNPLLKFFKQLISPPQPEQKTTSTDRVDTQADSGSVLEAKEKALEVINKAEEEAKKIKEGVNKARQELENKERRVDERAISLGKREDVLAQKQEDISKKMEDASKKFEEVSELKKEELRQLENVAALTKKEARERVLELVRKESVKDIARIVKEAGEQAESQAEVRVRDILISAIQRAGTDYVAEFSTSRVKLPSEDFKGRIIGREGRNIKALEQATGVDFDIDETPGEVRLSCFDSFRREIAKIALEKLIEDGRLQPAKIEETVVKVRADLERELEKVGEKLVYDAGVTGIPREVYSILGRCKFRTSYGQNLITHSLEVLNIGAYIAAELGLDVELVKKACLLHDIGKVLTGEVEGQHAALTRQILERYKFDEILINAAAAHHEDEEFKSPEALVVHIADAISGSRPGARFEDYEQYVKRMRDLEEAAISFDKVKGAYALSAGREVRVVAIPEKLKDEEVIVLANEIAGKIQEEHTYAGQIKVTVLKEVKAVGYAK